MILSQETKDRLRAMLLGLRRELMDEARAQISRNRDRIYEGDLGDRATLDMDSEYALMLSERLRGKILSIDECLEDIETGDYGICEECEEPISEKRLLLIPFARMCVRCQSELERQAKQRGQIIIESSVYSKAV